MELSPFEHIIHLWRPALKVGIGLSGVSRIGDKVGNDLNGRGVDSGRHGLIVGIGLSVNGRGVYSGPHGLIVGIGLSVNGRGVDSGVKRHELPPGLLFHELVGGWPNLPCRGVLKVSDRPPAIPPCQEQVPGPVDELYVPSAQ